MIPNRRDAERRGNTFPLRLSVSAILLYWRILAFGAEEMPEFSDFAFSTSWNWRGSDSGERVIEEILELGFDKVELNYRVTRGMLKTIVPYVERGAIEVPSVHNVFPSIEDSRFDTDSRMLGYRDETLRERAIALTIESIEAGRDVGAKALVVHPGVMPWDECPPSPSGFAGIPFDEELKRRWREEGPDSKAYTSLFSEFVEYRRRGTGGELERILASLEKVANYVERKGIRMRIGVENRPMCFQVPNFVEMEYLLDALAGGPIGMWFDTGHGAIQRNMGFFDDRAEASRLADRLVGMHIHDVEGVDDHFAPYMKEGLDPYLDLIRRSPIKVIELGMKNGREDVIAGTRRLLAKIAASAAAA
jgi:sugar phosphate isomerase/epimerase